MKVASKQKSQVSLVFKDFSDIPLTYPQKYQIK